MSAWRLMMVAVGLIGLAPASRAAEMYPLAETVQPGDCVRVQLEMKLNGELRVQRLDKTEKLELKAVGSHDYPERILSVGKDGVPDKTARVYETAKATITVGGSSSERTLRDDRRLIVAQRFKEQGLVYSPAGALSRTEADLTSEHFDSLTVVGVLPGKAVAVGDTWKIANTVVQALCSFEGVTEHSLSGKLDEVKDDVATFTVSGNAAGIEQGALVKMEVTAKGRFDLKTKRLVALEWTQKEERDAGPVSPASTVTTTNTLKRTPIDQPEKLSDVALVSVPDNFTPPALITQLELHDPKDRYELLYPREWVIVSATDEHQVLRLLDRGDFICQATISPWTAAEKGQHLSVDDFKTAMYESAGFELKKELQAGEVPSDEKGRWVYRLSTLGELEGVEVMQNFYLIAAPNGEQVVISFTMTPKQADKLGARDLSFVGGMDVPAVKK
jgi:hypothetical protein